MSEYESLTIFVAVISGLIAVISAVISLVSLVRTRKVEAVQIEQGEAMAKLAKRQFEQIEHDEAARDRPDFHVVLTKIGNGFYFCVTNVGDGIGKDVNFELVDHPNSSLVDTELFPVDIKPQATIKLDAYLHLGTPDKYNVRLTWTERDGVKNEELFKVKLT